MCICCCNRCLIDRLENFLLFFHSASTTFILCCLVIIKWSNLRFKIAHLILFILMELIYLVCLIFASLLSLWRAKNEIKSKNIKEKAKTVALISFILIVSLLVIILSECFSIACMTKKNIEKLSILKYSSISMKYLMKKKR